MEQERTEVKKLLAQNYEVSYCNSYSKSIPWPFWGWRSQWGFLDGEKYDTFKQPDDVNAILDKYFSSNTWKLVRARETFAKNMVYTFKDTPSPGSYNDMHPQGAEPNYLHIKIKPRLEIIEEKK